MKLGAWGVKLIAIIACGLLCVRSIYKMKPHSISDQNIVVHVDSSLAPETQTAITHFIKERTKEKIPTYSDFAQIIVQRFPCLKSVEFETNASGLFYCSLESVTPIISINNHLVLTDNGSLILKNSFAQHLTQSLCNIDVPSGVISHELTNNISTLVNDLLSNYYVNWVTDQEIHIYDKEQQSFSLVCNSQTLPDKNTLATCFAIKNELINESTSEKKKTKQLELVADVRFKNQIIVRSEQGSSSTRPSPEAMAGMIDGVNEWGTRFLCNKNWGLNHGGQHYG